MIVAALISGASDSPTRSLSTVSVSVMSTACRLRLANAVTRIRAPSSSRMLLWIFEAMNSSTSGGGFMPSCAAFLRRIAMRVSRSGACTSLIRPHSNRVRSRSSSEDSCRGALSELITICLFALCSVLNVWKNSSCVRSARSRNWMSSISSRSTER